MDIRFDVFWKRNLGSIYKDNSISVLGKEATVNIDLQEVSQMYVNFKVKGKPFTDKVTIIDVQEGLVRIPFKTDVIQVGLNELEVVAVMKNGDVLPSQTYTYSIDKSLENPNSVTAETSYPILIELLQDVGSKIEDVNEVIVKVEDSVEDMKTSIDNYKEEVRETINTDLTNYKDNTDKVLNSKFETYSTETTRNVSKIVADKSSELSNIVDTKINEVSDTLTNTVTTINTVLENKTVEVEDRVSSKIQEVDNKVNNKIQEVGTLVTGAINDLTSTVNNKIDEVNEVVDNKVHEVNDLMEVVELSETERVEAHQNMITELEGYSSDVSNLKSVTSTHTQEITELQGTVNNHNDRLNQVEGSVDNHETRIATNEKYVKTHDILVDALYKETLDDRITITEEGSVVSLHQSKEGMIKIEELQGNTLVNYCTDGSKELTLNGDIDAEGVSVTTTESVDGGKVDVMCEGNTLVNRMRDFSISYPNGFGETIANGYRLYLNPSETQSALRFEITFNNPIDLSDKTLQYNLIWTTSSNTHKITLVFDDGTSVHTHTHTNITNLNFLYAYGQLEKKVTKLRIYVNVNNSTWSETDYVDLTNVMLLEGDHTQNPPTYFEGMKSVGQDDENGHKIEILSQNKNLCKSDLVVIGKYMNTSGQLVNHETQVGSDFIQVIGGENIVSNLPYNNYFKEFDINKKYIRAIENSNRYTISKQAKYITFNFHHDNPSLWLQQNQVNINYGSTLQTYTEGLSNKKEILLNEPLRGVGDVKDKIVKIGGKWYIERNCSEVTLNGSEGWSLTYMTNGGTAEDGSNAGIGYWINNTVLLKDGKYNRQGLSDKMPVISGNQYALTGYNQIALHSSAEYSNYFYLSSEISDLTEFKAWLESNPITLIYQLETPTYEEVTDPTLLTYLDTTHISNNSIIPCNMKIQNSGYNTIIKPSTLYTVALDTNKSGTIGMNLGGAKVTTTNNVATITTPATLTDDSLRLYGKGIKASKVRLLEGDKTNWIPSHFEGMKSCFEDKLQDDGSYKMEILSNNKNLFDINKRINKSSKYWWAIPKLKANKMSFKFNTSVPHIEFYESNIDNIYEMYTNWTVNSTFKNVSQGTTVAYKTDKPYIIMAFDLATAPSEEVMKTLQVVDGDKIPTDYTPQITNKIQFSSIEPLRGIGETKDRFVFKDGKLMIERNCSIREYQEGDFNLDNILTDMVNTIYQLETPTYEEIPFELQKMLLECYEDGTLFFDTNIPPTSTITYSANIPVVSKLTDLNTMDTNLISTTWDMDYRLFELEWLLADYIPQVALSDLNIRTVNTKALSRFEQAKIMILGGAYNDTTLRNQLRMYLTRNIITQSEYDELIALMDERL